MYFLLQFSAFFACKKQLKLLMAVMLYLFTKKKHLTLLYLT